MTETASEFSVPNGDEWARSLPSPDHYRFDEYGEESDDVKSRFSERSSYIDPKPYSSETRSLKTSKNYRKESALDNAEPSFYGSEKNGLATSKQGLNNIEETIAYCLYQRESAQYSAEHLFRVLTCPQEVFVEGMNRNTERMHSKTKKNLEEINKEATSFNMRMGNFEPTMMKSGSRPFFNPGSRKERATGYSNEAFNNTTLFATETDDEFLYESVSSFNAPSSRGRSPVTTSRSLHKFRFSGASTPVKSRISGSNFGLPCKSTFKERSIKRSFAKDIKALLRLAKQKSMSEDLKTAQILCVKALKMLSNSPVPKGLLEAKWMTCFWNILAHIYKKSGDYHSAEECYRVQLEIAEKCIMPFTLKSSLYDLYEVLVQLKNYSEALDTLSELKSIAVYAEETVKIYHEMAHCHLQLKQLESAKENAQKGLKSLPNQVRNYWTFKLKLLLGIVEIIAENPSVSKLHFQDALELSSVSVDCDAEVADQLEAVLRVLNAVGKTEN